MLDFLVAGPNLAFATVLGLLLVFFVIEGAGLLFGVSLTGMLGDLDLPDMDFDFDTDFDPGFATKFLYWLKIGKVPLLILIVICMAIFVVCGYVLQYLCLSFLDTLMPGWLAVFVALLLTIPALRGCGRHLARLVPGDETSAISQSELVGGRATIVLGLSKQGSPAQARATDRHGTTHYLMVEPDDPEETLEPGRDLLLVRHAGNLFYAIYHPEPDGLDLAD